MIEQGAIKDLPPYSLSPTMTQKEQLEPARAQNLFPAFPVALVTAGENVASYGLIHIFSFKPPLIGVGVRRSRYTYEMIEKTGDFGVNLPGKNLVDAVNLCGSKSGRDLDKFEAAGLTKMKASQISSVLIEDCPINIECKVYKKMEMPEASHDWFLGEVVQVHMDEGADADDAILYWNKKYTLVGEKVGDRKA